RIQVLVTSGNGDAAVSSGLIPDDTFFSKPYAVEEVARRIHSLLEDRRNFTSELRRREFSVPNSFFLKPQLHEFPRHRDCAAASAPAEVFRRPSVAAVLVVG
ncbi:MAG: hypothetical protein WAN81_03755, partial [Candidatus Binataceae bacterium]